MIIEIVQFIISKTQNHRIFFDRIPSDYSITAESGGTGVMILAINSWCTNCVTLRKLLNKYRSYISCWDKRKIKL